MKRTCFILIALSVFSLASCTKNFEEANTDRTTAPDVPASSLLTRGILDVSGYDYATWRANFIYTTLFVQQFASTAWQQGDKYFFDEGYSNSQWSDYYPSTIKGLANLVQKTTANADDINYNSAARVLKAYSFMRLTDLYGDIPYSEASKGYTDAILTPKYDKQQDIYNDLLKELDAAATAFNATKPFNGDVTSYNGNTALWKKAAYSIMLRVAMHLSKADATAAKTWAAKAVAGGVIAAYDESFRINHLATVYDNPNSHILGYYNGARVQLKDNAFKFSTKFLGTLTALGDPRAKILSVVRSTTGTEDDNPLIQKGLTNGTDPNTLPGGAIQTYSQLRADFVDATDPNILVSHGQTLLLMAEAAERGWITGTAATLFKDGVKSSINQLKLYSLPSGIISDAATDAYVLALPYTGTTDQKLASINTQYWITSLLDGHESFANWRRSGYPVLTAVNYPGNYTNGVIPRRLQYPSSEPGINGTNYNEAVARQGADKFVTKVWWDK